MKKNIYTGIFCTILGLCINTPANASIISRSFLDEALTDYATTTALDLKANQSDFRELNTQISDSVDLLRELLIRGSTSYEFVNNINPEKFPNTISGAFGLLYQYLDGFAGSILYGWTDSNGRSYAGFNALNNGWTDSEKNTYLGVKGLNDKIGTLPTTLSALPPFIEIFGMDENIDLPTDIGGILSLLFSTDGGKPTFYGLANAIMRGYVSSDGTSVPGLRGINDKIGTLPDGETVANMLSWQEPISLPLSDNYSNLLFNTHKDSNNPKTVKEAIQTLFSCNSSPGSTGPCFPVMAGNIFIGKPLSDEILNSDNFKDNYPGLTEYKGLLQLTADIGTLPTGRISSFTGSEYNAEIIDFLETKNLPVTYQSTLGKFMSEIYEFYLPTMFAGWTDSTGKKYGGLIDLNNRIGTLPRGGLTEISPEMGALFKFTQDTDTPVYPSSLSDLINQLYGNTAGPGAITALVKGFYYEGFSDDYEVNVGILPAMELGFTANTAAKTALETANRAKALAESNATAIGTLPTFRISSFTIGEQNAEIMDFLETKKLPVTYPSTLGKFMSEMYEIYLHTMFAGWTDTTGKEYGGLIDLNNQIGTLPSGTLIGVGGGIANSLYQSAQQTSTPLYPTSMADFVLQIYGEAGTTKGIVPMLVTGINSAKSSASSASSKATTAQTTANNAKAAADANTAKIGTLPTEYATVGAALSAIKGIAEEAKAAALAAIPDPKTEGSNGKYVLTVDIVGDNATYRWEPIDRSKTTTTTE